MKNLKLFDLTSEYLAYTADISNMILPNVSLCKDNGAKVYYNSVNSNSNDEISDRVQVLCKYNIEDTDNDIKLFNNGYAAGDKIIESITIDGVQQDSVFDTYRFVTIGEHTVLFTFKNDETAIPEALFSACTSITSVTMNNLVTAIYSAAFSACMNLTNITIPDSVIQIYQQAFEHCYALTSITIPASVEDMGDNMFLDCENLTNIICNATTAPEISTVTFSGIASNGTLTVPAGSTGYDVWIAQDEYYLGNYKWTKVEV